ncbi:MAG: bifunctional oligoribonuclease/PAP phosphatase NrnA [Candidatus Spechtbacterales bacterium]
MKLTNATMRTPLEEQFENALRLIEESDCVLLCGHQNPDGDSIGAVLAFAAALEDNNPKQVMCYAREGIPETFAFLPGAERFNTRVPWFPDLIVAFDYGNFERLELSEDIVAGARILTFDHHPPERQRGDVKVISTECASTTELLYAFMCWAGWHISRDTATALLTGIITDTGAFSHNVWATTMKAAGELVELGAPLQDIYARTFAGKSPAVLNAWGDILQKMEHHDTFNCVAVTVPFSDFKKYGIVLDDLDGMVNVLNVVAGTEFAVFMVEYEPGKVKGSLRSEEFKGRDVSVIAKRLGGGGHIYASGFKLEGSLGDVQRQVEAAIEQELLASHTA